ncbi:SDH family Clp fold serine proteinase [Zhihengliuella sp. ISTPL4]|uniref:SDH family Clp fold serine proteinase n=1 Tax=Zhihengliuella sp. ISTPL4 TaxID=2058657 RepID=UPI000C7DF5D9|nr:ATP-dependent Clp protease proteolytic subunit [Zhihengliuella sp. ISTPL4]
MTDGAPRQRTHLFSAQHADRYDRQQLIRRYQELTRARLIVMVDQVFHHSVTLLEELLSGASPEQELHLLLSSPGGDGEVAVRLVRAMQARCSRLTIIIPDMAKSAATIMALGAHEILMTASSDLGPVDPQFPINGRLVGAKEIEQAVKDAEARVAEAPDTFPLYSGLLADVNMLMVEQARSAMARSYTLIEEALSCSGLDEDSRSQIAEKLKGPLVDDATMHGATVGPDAARSLGLPVTTVDPESESWQLIWALWTRYFHLGAWPAGNRSVYEGELASQTFGQ